MHQATHRAVQAPSVWMADPRGRFFEVQAEAEQRVVQVLRSGRYIGGPVVAEAEQAAAALFFRQGAVGVGNGTDALMLALSAVGVRAGHEVIVPALSFFATAGAVANVGAVPVIVDVLDNGCLDPHAAAQALTANTAAMVPVHLFGTRAGWPALGLPVVEDAAQAVGLPKAGPPATLTAVSCYPTKTWGAAGDAGFVLGDDPELLCAVRALANHGLGDKPHHHQRIGGAVGRNSRLDPIQAAVLLAHVPRLNARIARRRAIATFYDANLPPGVRPLPRSADSPCHHYGVLVPERDGVARSMAEAGVQTAVYYTHSLADQPALTRRFPTPVADRIARTVLHLPIHSGLDAAALGSVISALHQAVASP